MGQQARVRASYLGEDKGSWRTADVALSSLPFLFACCSIVKVKHTYAYTYANTCVCMYVGIRNTYKAGLLEPCVTQDSYCSSVFCHQPWHVLSYNQYRTKPCFLCCLNRRDFFVPQSFLLPVFPRLRQGSVFFVAGRWLPVGKRSRPPRMPAFVTVSATPAAADASPMSAHPTPPALSPSLISWPWPGCGGRNPLLRWLGWVIGEQAGVGGEAASPENGQTPFFADLWGPQLPNEFIYK